MEVGNTGRSPYEVGFDDHHDGKTITDNPYWNGEFTKLGARRLSDDARDWENGFNSRNLRIVSQKEINAAAKVDISRFRRKANNYYK